MKMLHQQNISKAASVNEEACGLLASMLAVRREMK